MCGLLFGSKPEREGFSRVSLCSPRTLLCFKSLVITSRSNGDLAGGRKCKRVLLCLRFDVKAQIRWYLDETVSRSGDWIE